MYLDYSSKIYINGVGLCSLFDIQYTYINYPKIQCSKLVLIKYILVYLFQLNIMLYIYIFYFLNNIQ